jgi:hypothetical protein
MCTQIYLPGLLESESFTSFYSYNSSHLPAYLHFLLFYKYHVLVLEKYIFL